MDHKLASFAIGAGTLLALLVVAAALGANPARLAEGQDGRASTSKFQWFVWTGVILFAYAAIYAARAFNGHAEPLTSIPPNVLIALGLSSVTMVAAKGITSSFVNTGKLAKAPSTNGVLGEFKGLVADDNDVADISKFQMLGWTGVAIGVYIYSAVTQVNGIFATSSAPGALPDIDSTLLWLMGLSHAGYLGKKAITTDPTPRLMGISTKLATPGTVVTIFGSNLGDGAGSTLLMDDLAITPKDWKDDHIAFVLPLQRPDGAEWAASQAVSVTINVSGRIAMASLQLQVKQAAAAAGGLDVPVGGNGARLAARVATGPA